MAEVRLRPIRMSDADQCFRWIADPDVTRYLGLVQPPTTAEGERAWIARVLADKAHQRVLVIEDEEGRAIGTCGLRGIDRESGSALLGIMIGEKSRWDRGYGTAATRKLLELGFMMLGLRQIRLSCHGENRRGLRCYQKAGFRVSRTSSVTGAYGWDEVRMEITREEWQQVQADAEAR
jgi:RimJ/RimL family protein N-acetyltransferase